MSLRQRGKGTKGRRRDNDVASLCRCLLLLGCDIDHTQFGQAALPSPFVGDAQRVWIYQESGVFRDKERSEPANEEKMG